MTSLVLIYTGFLAFNISGRISFIKLMNDVLTLANSQQFDSKAYDDELLLKRFVAASYSKDDQ